MGGLAGSSSMAGMATTRAATATGWQRMEVLSCFAESESGWSKLLKRSASSRATFLGRRSFGDGW